MAPLFNSIRHYPPAESLGNQVGRLTFIFLSSWGLEAHTTLRNGCRCHRHCDFFAVWSGSMALAESRPVDVCLETIYGLNSGVFLSTLLHLPYPDRGVVWRSVQSVFTRLFTPLVLLFCPPGYVHLYVAVFSPSPECGLFFTNRIRRRLESPCTCSYSLVQPGPVLDYRFYCLSARDTVLPYSL